MDVCLCVHASLCVSAWSCTVKRMYVYVCIYNIYLLSHF